MFLFLHLVGAPIRKHGTGDQVDWQFLQIFWASILQGMVKHQQQRIREEKQHRTMIYITSIVSHTWYTFNVVILMSDTVINIKTKTSHNTHLLVHQVQNSRDTMEIQLTGARSSKAFGCILCLVSFALAALVGISWWRQTPEGVATGSVGCHQPVSVDLFIAPLILNAQKKAS